MTKQFLPGIQNRSNTGGYMAGSIKVSCVLKEQYSIFSVVVVVFSKDCVKIH